MYLDFTVPIPDLPGKIGRFKKGNTVYIRYVVDRKYHPVLPEFFSLKLFS